MPLLSSFFLIIASIPHIWVVGKSSRWQKFVCIMLITRSWWDRMLEDTQQQPRLLSAAPRNRRVFLLSNQSPKPLPKDRTQRQETQWEEEEARNKNLSSFLPVLLATKRKKANINRWNNRFPEWFMPTLHTASSSSSSSLAAGPARHVKSRTQLLLVARRNLPSSFATVHRQIEWWMANIIGDVDRQPK